MDSDAGLAEALSGLAEAVGAGSTDDERFGGDENAAPDDDAAHAALLARFQDAYAALEDDEDRPLVVDRCRRRAAAAAARASPLPGGAVARGAGRDGAAAARPWRRRRRRRRRRRWCPRSEAAPQAAVVGGGGGGRRLRRARAMRVPRGREVWCAERDGSIAVRDAHTAALRAKIMVSLHDVTIGAMAAKDGLVWCATHRGRILIFEATTRALRRELRAHGGGVHAIAPSNGRRGANDFVVTGGADFKLLMFGAAEPHKLRKAYSGHGGAVRSALVLGMQIWSGSDDGTVRVWDAAAGLFGLSTDGCVATLSGHTGSVSALAAYADAVYSAGADGTVRCWAVAGAHAPLRSVSVGSAVAALVPMGRQLWAAAQDGAIHALAPATLARVGAPRAAHASFVTGLCKLPARTTRRCWSFSLGDGAVRVWTQEEMDGQVTSEKAAAAAAEAAALDEALAEQLERLAEEKAARAAAEADVAFLGTQGDALRADVAAGEAARRCSSPSWPPRWRSRRPT